MKLKSTATDIIAIVGAALAVIPNLFKKKPFVLWYRGRDEKWYQKGGPFSHRQCVKTMSALVDLGSYEADRFVILRKGVTP